MPGDSHDELIGRCLDGDEDAFCDLARRHLGRLRAYIARFVASRDDVDDIAQETFVAAFRSLDRYDRTRPFAAWLLGIAHHQVLRWLRDRQRRDLREQSPLARLMGAWAIQSAGVESPEPIAQLSLFDALEHCLGRLPDHHQHLLQEHYGRGRSLADLARARGTGVGGLRMVAMRLRRSLRACIERGTSIAGAGHAGG